MRLSGCGNLLKEQNLEDDVLTDCPYQFTGIGYNRIAVVVVSSEQIKDVIDCGVLGNGHNVPRHDLGYTNLRIIYYHAQLNRSDPTNILRIFAVLKIYAQPRKIYLTKMSVPKNHPRYQSLKIRERLVEGVASGIASQVGLIAHGRGEAFDYLIGERTTASAMEGARAAAAMLLAAKNPVLSVNGNVAALVPNETIELGRILDATIEINLFYRTDERVRAIADHLRAHGASDLLGEHPDPDAALPLAHPRSLVCRDGIHAADVVLVPLEDGDRCQTLVDMRKSVIAIDLNPLSRTAQSATITIVDNVVRAIPNMIELVQQIRDFSEDRLTEIILQYDNHDALQSAIAEIVERGWRSELS
uniref:4-phosphopantoate--beta-alanine ligase n=3 Tax=Candidatus Methanogaster sp. ANME-2c ERB4 TaxID=2759911 RepID=A0A7G9Y7D0_9EURY|nr:hypothetical protein NANOEKIO_00013 [Methanosarcinales archaeon ANME-2c ERB4]QNO44467.1 hypothetical protein ELEJOALA_00013 [Methanosarcinales archaeon ANME-2c ERB4]QNO45199.1 hypothetical protein KDMJNAGO_00013 [Methanosarcinales archaeon ANME-2c ERB4]